MKITQRTTPGRAALRAIEKESGRKLGRTPQDVDAWLAEHCKSVADVRRLLRALILEIDRPGGRQ